MLTDTPARRRRPGRVAAVVAVLAMTLMWIYAFSGLARRDPPDYLDDERFAVAAEARCADTLSKLDDLPIVTQESPPEELAPVVDEANHELAEMVAALRDLAPTEGERAGIVEMWLDDWDTYLGDRQEWAERVQGGEVAEFGETDRGGEPISKAIDNLAEVNDMDSCVTP